MGFTCGWTFTVDEMITVRALGQWDWQRDGLDVVADVGLWEKDSTTLLATVQVPEGTGGILVADHRFIELITPVELSPGIEYVIGSTYQIGGPNTDDLEVDEFNPIVNPTGGAFASGAALTFPTSFDEPLRSGPSFLFGDGPIIPIPAAVWLFGSALGLLGWLRRSMT